jgi:hypothetical protein
MVTARDRRYWASKEKRIRFKTVEIYHESLGVLRYVLNQFNDKEFTLEADAPRNPSETVTFSALSGELSDESQTGLVVNRSLSLGRVGTEIKQKLKLITNTDRYKSAQMIVRYYIKGEESAPSNVPELYYISKIDINEGNVTITSSDELSFNSRISRVYREDELTGMQGFL